MTFLTLVRHGETDWNNEGRIQGSSDIPLNETGRAQARAAVETLREQLDPEQPFEVVASDLSRARETAQIIASGLGARVVRLYPALRERAYGQAEGILISEFHDRFGSWERDDVPEAESRPQLRARGVKALQRVVRDSRRSGGVPAVIAVSHGALIREMIAHATADQQPTVGERILNCSAHSFLIERDAVRLLASARVPV